MGQAHLREFFAKTDSQVGLAPGALTSGTEVFTEVVDRLSGAYPSALKAAAILTVVADGATAADEYVARLRAFTSDDEAFTTSEELVSFEQALAAPAEGVVAAAVVLPAKMVGAKKFVRYGLTVTADGGNSGTATLSAAIIIESGGHVDGDPVPGFSQSGYVRSEFEAA